jgi:hypothetical protein
METEYSYSYEEDDHSIEGEEDTEYTENGTAMEAEKRAFSAFPPVDSSTPIPIDDWDKLLADLASSSDQKQALILLRNYVLTNSIMILITN